MNEAVGVVLGLAGGLGVSVDMVDVVVLDGAGCELLFRVFREGRLVYVLSEGFRRFW